MINYNELKQKIDAAIDKNLQGNKTSGIVSIVKIGGETIYERAVGFADLQNQVMMQKDTLFRYASISKAFTSLAICALIHQKKLSLDTKVTQFLPEFKPTLKNGVVPDITIYHLLGHQAGLDYRWAQKEDGPYATLGVSDGLDITDFSLEENMRRLSKAPLAFEPGTNWLYSLSPDLLGLLIEKVTNLSFEKALNELVLKPLNISDITFSVKKENEKQLAKPYYLGKNGLTLMADDQYLTSPDDRYFHFSPQRAFMQNQYASGGVGLIGSATSLMKIVEVIRTNKASFASDDLLDTFSKNQLKNIEARPGMGFTLGWGIIENPQRAENTPQSVGTLAWGGVYGSKWFTDRKYDLSVVTMTTTALDEVVSVDIRNAIYSVLKA